MFQLALMPTLLQELCIKFFKDVEAHQYYPFKSGHLQRLVAWLPGEAIRKTFSMEMRFWKHQIQSQLDRAQE